MGSKNKLVLASKGLDNAGPSVVSSVANRNVGFGNSTTVQALSLLDNLGQELMAQNLLASVTSSTGIQAMVGDSSRQEAGDVISFNERHSVNLAVLGLAIEELSTNEVAVEVGKLDSDKHMAVIFLENKEKQQLFSILKCRSSIKSSGVVWP
ncbi:hypothetical protein GOBAR_AA33588 [Gossypium barbadense]|uniref:Uncharacterized protein n=1 Tax=Gossypium barbadense TaxID=3634 RepID=A0A2P5W7M1_GOSBA|nr:hypothetical protein GOBAR_AA33588 [Gossypium barbadense]